MTKATEYINFGFSFRILVFCIHQPDRVARKASDVSAADW